MAVVVVRLKLSLPGSHSLKDKRRILKSLKDRLRSRFNVAVAEMEHHDVWQSADLGVVTISPDGNHARSTASRVAGFIGGDSRLSLLDYTVEVF